MEIPVFIKNQPRYTVEDDQFIRENFPTKTHKYLARYLNRSVDSIRGRCRTLDLIRPAAPRKVVVAPARTGCRQPDGLDLSTLPANLQSWFGLVEGFEPEQGTHVAERMPNIPTKKPNYHIGSGTCAHIEMLANS